MFILEKYVLSITTAFFCFYFVIKCLSFGPTYLFHEMKLLTLRLVIIDNKI